MRLLLLALLTLISAACTHGSVGYRSTTYTEVPVKPMSQMLAEALGTGYTVQITEGPDSELKLPGSGVQFGSYAPLGNSNWDFEVAVAFQKYSNIPYKIQYQKGGTSGSFSFTYDVTGSTLDLDFGYRWRWLRPYAGLRRDTYIMSSTDPFFYNTTTISNLFGIGGLDITIPVSSGVGIALRGDYATCLTKDSTVKSADTITAQLNLIWGLDKRP